jgi:hypothetical protein
VTNQQGWDTGVAIANTSLTPGSLPSAALRAGFSNSAQPQDGAVQFWYYPTRTTDPPVPTQCTNVATPGDCTGAKTVVKAGETLTFSLAFGNSAWGIKPTPGFQGYMIAQAGFQYCHAFAFMGPQGAPVTTNGQSVGYLGLQLDNNDTLGSRTSVPAESLDH